MVKYIADIVVLSISVLWTWSGIVKLIAPHAFRHTLNEHGLIPASITSVVAIGVPLLEVILGIGIAWVLGRTLPTMRLLIFSLALICLMTGYLLAVPSEVIAKSGCGCQGGVSTTLTERAEIDARIAAVGFNTILFTAHTITLILLRSRMRVRATECPT